MRLLITGGLGYIGGRLAGYFKKNKPDSDIFLAGHNNYNFPPKWTTGSDLVYLELQDELAIQQCIKKSKPDCIIHLAALNDVDSKKNPDLAEDINHKGTKRLVKIAYDNGIKRFIYFSTFHVYKKIFDSVITESTPTEPLDVYSSTHLAAEKVVSKFNNRGMRNLIFRLSNGYGYPADKNINCWSLVMNDLCKQAVLNKRIVLKSSGKQQRDFISLSDVARAIEHFVFSIPDDWGDGLYNLGGECSLSILELVQIILKTYRNCYKEDIKEIKVGTDCGDNFKPVRYSIEKLKSTGFKLEGSMTSEIEKTFSFCEDFLNEGIRL